MAYPKKLLADDARPELELHPHSKALLLGPRLGAAEIEVRWGCGTLVVNSAGAGGQLVPADVPKVELGQWCSPELADARGTRP